ncbi:MAG TPA: glycerol-3-phosphate dehydrogenase/oxidase [Verrucomicrobiae bacterium]|nr:glycerol-3-phosphate dehydrogenase/oxidase [Verrucomicrobiae bacterium]
MNRELSALTGQEFDVLVIGGGIFGAGVARDAALRGLRVALVEQSDFASGTSSRSSKLIHGGFRYLAQRNFRLVFESCRERRILQRIAPHLVHPLPFLFPIYAGSPVSLGKLRLGMTLYDCLALYRNVGPHRTLSPSAALAAEPALSRDGLLGAVRFYDCQEDDARFCVENVLHAAELGAVCANYCAVTGFATRGDRVIAASVADRLGTDTFEVAARVFVNAAGPWVEKVCSLTPFGATQPLLSPAKGVHLLLPKLTERHAIVFSNRRDGRILLVVPWGDGSLVGATDTDFRGDPGAVRVERSDIEYLLTEVRALFPDASISESDIVATTAGVRPLLRSDAATPSARSREHRIARHGRNLLSIAGGKYTTFRLIAQQAVDAVYEMLDMMPAPCLTTEEPLPNRRPAQAGETVSDSPVVHASDVAHACQQEMAVTLSDVMRRRTPLALSRNGGAETAARVARLMAPVLHWSADEERVQLDRYLRVGKQDRP